MIESHTGFQPLKEVWLGDCYPESYYASFTAEEQDFFGRVTESTKEDLTKLQKKIESLGVTVRRPEFDNQEKYLDDQGNLIKPPITPRDWGLTLDNTLYVMPQYLNNYTGYDLTIDQYRAAGQQVTILDRGLPDPFCYISPASVVRVGNDVFVDCGAPDDSQEYKYFKQAVEMLEKDYRVHVTRTGDHSDAVFCPIASGQIFSTHYRQRYEKTFPGWEVFFLTDTTKSRNNGYTNWWVPGRDYQTYNPNIVDRARSWLGDSRETIFEVNMLVIDDCNIICIAEDDNACRRLEELGITPHIVDFRTRGFWDGGIHCLTLDIHRTGGKVDYWPGRGPKGITCY